MKRSTMSPEGAERFKKRIEAMKRHTSKHGIFPLENHVEKLKLDSTFFDSLNKDTKILEIGSASGRLADFLIKKRKLNPKNYEMMDLAYNKDEMPFTKGRIHRLMESKKIKKTQANMLRHNYPAEEYHHILVPEAFLAATEGYSLKELALRDLLNKLGPAVKSGGTIRISDIRKVTYDNFVETLPKDATRILEDFDVEHTGAGLILKKKSK